MSQSNEIYNCLLKSLVDLLIFLEFSNDDDLNPDVAIQVMEQLSARFLNLSETEKSQLLSEIVQLSTEFSGEKADFIMDIGESLGLA